MTADLNEENKNLKKENASLKKMLLRQSKNKETDWHQSVMDALPNPVFIKTAETQFFSFNQAFANMLGDKKENIIGKTDYDFTSKEQSDVFRKVDLEVLENGITNWNEEDHTMENNKKRLLTSKTRIQDKEGNFYVLGVITDITDNQNQQTLIQKKMNEIELQKNHIQALLMEVHHRVKNNLQIINSILNLQKSQLESEVTQKVIDSAQNRIFAMAKIHEILCEHEGLSAINLNSYIQSLTENLVNSADRENSIAINLKIPNLLFNMETAIPLGMIINEIVTNSIKYATHDDENLEIYIQLKKKKGKSYELRIGDNGISEFPKHAKPSLGSELIEIFSHQLEGSLLRLDKDSGTHYEILFHQI